MTVSEYVSALMLVIGAVFFLAGTVGLLRFPDVYTRLHALTKADNLGLGFIIIGLAIQAESWPAIAKLILIWLLILLAGACVSYLISNAALRQGIRPWKR